MDDRRIDDKVMVFGDSGLRIDDALVFWDHETESLWEQWRGLAFEGDMKGIRLVRIAAPTVRWADWLEQHPDSLVLVRTP